MLIELKQHLFRAQNEASRKQQERQEAAARRFRERHNEEEGEHKDGLIVD